jgi:competence protein ComEA
MRKLFSGFIFLACFSFPSFVLATEAVSLKALSTESAQVQSHLININTADISALSSLKGIGAKKAEAIIAWREANGNFKNIEQLLDVKGIGIVILEDNRDKISI